MAHQSLVRGGVLKGQRHEVLPHRQFRTSTPIVVTKKTHIVAVASPDLEKGDPVEEDGWFLSDFYALNYLYKGQGLSQVWLTAVDPVRLVNKYGNFLHGNPYQDRKVVLSHELLKSNQITSPTVVSPTDMIDSFKSAIRKAAKAAAQDDGNVLVLMFCHGVDAPLMVSLDATVNIDEDKDVSRYFTIADLKEAAGPLVRMTLVTTACYSGGWLVHPDINMTGMAAANDEVSESWLKSGSVGRYCGSIFISALINNLTSTASTLLPEEEESKPGSTNDKPQKLQPTNPTEKQTMTYNAFCHSVWDVLGSRLYRRADWQDFTFKAQDDDWEAAWTGRTGMELARYEHRWSQLATYRYTGSQTERDNLDPSPLNTTFAGRGQVRTGGGAQQRGSRIAEMEDLMMSRPTKRRVQQLAKIFSETCPGDENTPWNIPLSSMLRGCMETGNPQKQGGGENRECWNLFAVVQYRIDLARLADNLVDAFHLPRPDNTECLMWNARGAQGRWIYGTDPATTRSEINSWLLPNGTPSGTREQGPPFARFRSYLRTALLLANMNKDTCRRVVEQLNAAIEEAQAYNQRRLLADPEVRQRGREWARSIGRRIRQSLSPTKRSVPTDAPRRGLGQEESSSSSRQDPRRSLGPESPALLRQNPQGSPAFQRLSQPSASSPHRDRPRLSPSGSRGQEGDLPTSQWTRPEGSPRGAPGPEQAHRWPPSPYVSPIRASASSPGPRPSSPSPGAPNPPRLAQRGSVSAFNMDAMGGALADDGMPHRDTSHKDGKGKGKGKEAEPEPEDKEPGFW